MSTQRLFGTDGVRGVAGQPPLDAATVLAIGSAVGAWLGRGAEAPRVVLGGDTRASTAEISGLLAAALERRGVEVINAGVIPTPGIAWLIPHLEADAGIVVSASHNPYTDNGIKLLSAHGRKLDPAVEKAIEKEALALAPMTGIAPRLRPADPDLIAAYREQLVRSLDPDALAGLRLIVDAANGAAASLAGEVATACGAAVTVLNDRPDGVNINRDCGSTHPQGLQREVRAHGAHLGLALDGDADRAVLVDETGELRDGDAILYLWAGWLADLGELAPPAIVATSMSNLGLERALAERGIGTVRCEVGDRAVVETLEARGLRLGGEQSGHVVDLESSSTGDGLLTGLRVAAIVAASGRTLSQLLERLRRFPQRLVNVPVGDRPPVADVPELAAAIDRAREALGDDGRLVVRYSGTEPLLRIMIEARELSQVDELTRMLAETASRAIPSKPAASSS